MGQTKHNENITQCSPKQNVGVGDEGQDYHNATHTIGMAVQAKTYVIQKHCVIDANATYEWDGTPRQIVCDKKNQKQKRKTQHTI